MIQELVVKVVNKHSAISAKAEAEKKKAKEREEQKKKKALEEQKKKVNMVLHEHRWEGAYNLLYLFIIFYFVCRNWKLRRPRLSQQRPMMAS